MLCQIPFDFKTPNNPFTSRVLVCQACMLETLVEDELTNQQGS